MNLHDHPELADRLAAAHALGTLRGGARRRFETLARQNPALRARALLWQERFAAMTELQPAEMPSPNVWKRIENLLPRETAPLAAAPDRGARLLALWRRAAFAGGAVAVALAVLAVGITRELRQQNETLAARLQSQPQVQYVAVLSDQQQSASLLATFDARHQVLTLKRVGAVAAPPDRSLQLWSVVPGAAPRSLGLLGEEPSTRLQEAMPDLEKKPLLAVSLEPRGGAPAGSGPTGPVLFKGPLLQAAL
jgi:anti-sigma-K factor RskA